jgi:hypothetical protein
VYSGNAWYCLAQKLLSSRLFSKNVKIRICNKTVILFLVLYGCETWYLTLREEHRLRVSENKVLRRIFGPKIVEGTCYEHTYGTYLLPWRWRHRCVLAVDTVTCVFILAMIFFYYSIKGYLLSLPQLSNLLSTNHPTIPGNRDSSVGIATGYGLDDQRIGVWVPVRSRIFSSPRCADKL